MNIMQQPYFLNNGGNRKAKDGIMLWYAGKNPYISSITCTGTITIHSTYNGVPTAETYSNLSDVAIAIKADPNTEVYIKGIVTSMVNDSSEKRIRCHYTSLKRIECEYCSELEELTLSDNGNLQDIKYDSCPILTELNLSNNGNQYLSIEGHSCNRITKIDLSSNAKLGSLDCHNCPMLQDLNLSENKTMYKLNCSSCSQLTELDLSANMALMELDCTGCIALKSLKLPETTALTTIYCGSCSQLTELNLSANTALKLFVCNFCSKLTNLDLQANVALTTLGCISCAEFTELDLSMNKNLSSLSFDILNITKIYAIAKVQDVANSIIRAFDSAFTNNGTLYINSSDTYASTVTSAATTKGWTVKALPAA